MKEWTEEERGGPALDAKGKVKRRDKYAYERLRKFFFSKEFMVAHWYVLERDRPTPMELTPVKACKVCGIQKRNDFKEFPKEPWGDAKIGKHTTGDTCRLCMSQAISTGILEKLDRERAAAAAYEQSGDEMWTKK